MKITKEGARTAASPNHRTPWAAATLLGLAWAGSAHAVTALGPAMLDPTACFHKDQGFIARAQLDLGSEPVDGLFDVYKGVHYQGQWAFQDDRGQWMVLPPFIGVVPVAGSAVRHPQRTLGAGVNTLDVGIAEPALRTPGMLPGITVFAGYGASGPQSFADLLVRQRFGVMAQVVGNDPCATTAIPLRPHLHQVGAGRHPRQRRQPPPRRRQHPLPHLPGAPLP